MRMKRRAPAGALCPITVLRHWHAYKQHAISVSMRQKRAYRYRFYPTPDQEAALARTFGCTRYVYN
jgi:hypothetical protein